MTSPISDRLAMEVDLVQYKSDEGLCLGRRPTSGCDAEKRCPPGRRSGCLRSLGKPPHTRR